LHFVSVQVEPSNAIMLQGMESSTLGVWVAHGEGRCFGPDETVKQEAYSKHCVALKYVDDDGEPTMEYPMNQTVQRAPWWVWPSLMAVICT